MGCSSSKEPSYGEDPEVLAQEVCDVAVADALEMVAAENAEKAKGVDA